MSDNGNALSSDRLPPEPRWPGLLAVFAYGLLHFAMPEAITVGPGWLTPVLIVMLLIPTVLTHRSKKLGLNDVFAYGALGVITVSLLSSVGLLVRSLPDHSMKPVDLLRAASILWVGNILVFASWYWRLDGGGPNERDRRGIHRDGAFLFPQMVLPPELQRQMGEDKWSPGFIDYLFLAFNTSTAFSPTDVPVLSRWAKAMMIVQSLISLTTVALLAARAVNII